MNQRTDPSSLHFGRRLAKAEADAAQAKAELKDLKQSLPGSKELQSAALAGDAIKAQRKAAKQLMARADVSLAELSSIDPSALTPMFQEQLRLSKRDAALREMPMTQQQFQFATPEAQARFDNWRTTLTPQQNFVSNNVLPGEARPQRPFDLWSARQDSPEGRLHRNRVRQQELITDEMLAKSKANMNKPKAGGRRIGGIKDLNN